MKRHECVQAQRVQRGLGRYSHHRSINASQFFIIKLPGKVLDVEPAKRAVAVGTRSIKEREWGDRRKSGKRYRRDSSSFVPIVRGATADDCDRAPGKSCGDQGEDMVPLPHRIADHLAPTYRIR